MALSLGDIGVLAIIVAMPLGLVGLFLRSIRADARTIREDVVRFQRDMGARVEKHEIRLQELEQTRVGHKDWVRVIVAQENRQRALGTQLAELSGKLDATVGIAGGLKRIGDAIERQVTK